jgi:LysM repeat protein
MTKKWKLGMPAKQKIRSVVKFFGIFSAIAALVIPMLACSQTYVSALDLTATAQTTVAAPSTQTASPLPVTNTPDPSPLPTFTLSPSPTANIVSTKTVTVTKTAGGQTEISPTPKPPIIYYTQSGDTLPSIAIRFGVGIDQIETSVQNLPKTGLISPNTLLVIPDVLSEVGPKEINFPDSEVVYSPSALDFDTDEFVSQAGGYLSTYREYLTSGWYTGAQLIDRVAIENSVNPRLLLAILQYQSNWVYGQPTSLAATDYPLGNTNYIYRYLYRQLSWAVSQLSIGYYGWRAGLLTEVKFPNQDPLHLAPGLNAGTVAVQYLFAQLITDPLRWMGALNGPGSLIDLYQKMFGNPWQRAQMVEPLYPPTLSQPFLELPFEPGHTWSFTGGPHSAWGPEGALAALDFAPRAETPGCVKSDEWVVASAPGKIVRSENGVVILDLNNDGVEQTGWDILYLHIATLDRIPVGTFVDTNDRIGHPSCEGGVATGTNVHIARKFNGEWILADGAVPFVLSGYTAHNGTEDYKGTLTKGNTIIEAHPTGMQITLITRPK